VGDTPSRRRTMNAAEWEAAWSEYITALEDDDALDAGVYDGENFVIYCGRIARNLREVKGRLRAIDRNFCDRLGI
jgi:hypothetical protein